MEEEWELVDIVGEFSAWAMTPESNVLVHAIGSHVIVWNLDTEQKIHLRCHDNLVSSILFCSSGKYFVTIEQSLEPFICVWDLENLTQVSFKFLPMKLRKFPPSLVEVCQSETTLYVLEVEKESGYRVSRWSWDGPNLTFTDVHNLELKEKAFKIRPLTADFFFTIEKQFIKIWECSKSIYLSKRLYFKSEIIDADYSFELKAFCLLLGTFQFIIVNSSGQILTNFNEQYSAFTINGEYLFLGGSTLQIYGIKNYSLVSELLETEIRIKKILTNGGSLACIAYENSTVNIVEMEKGMTIKAVAYHGTPVHSFVWNVDGNFATGGDEACIYLWTKLESGWGLEALQLSTEQVSALDMYNSILAIGFTSGAINTYNSQFELLSTSRLGQVKVKKLKFTQSLVLFSSFANGNVVMLDTTYSKVAGLLSESGIGVSRGFSLCELNDIRETLILVCTLQDPKTLAIHRISKKETLKLTGFSNLALESKCEDFVIHSSGKYIIVSLDIGCICLYEIFSCKIVGVIENSGVLSLDSSGLYLSCIQIADSSKVYIYEVGTGDLVTEMGRIVQGQEVFFSFDGKLLGVIASTGKIEIWKLPEVIRFNIEKMLTRGEEDIWERFPVEYENTTIKKKSQLQKIPEEAFANNTTFAETVISLVPKPVKKSQRENLEIPQFKPPYAELSRMNEQNMGKIEQNIVRSELNFVRGEQNFIKNEPNFVRGEQNFIKNEPKISKLYTSGGGRESFNYSLPAQRYSHVHEPKFANNEVRVDSPISLTEKKKNKEALFGKEFKRTSEKAPDMRKGKRLDEPISLCGGRKGSQSRDKKFN